MQDKTLVVILPDSGERWLSSVLFEGMFGEWGEGLMPAATMTIT